MRLVNHSISLLIACCFPMLVSAGGFQVNLQGQKQNGMGHCGTSLISGASSSFFNPGAFAFVEKSHIELGASFIVSRLAYQENYPGTNTSNTVPGIGTPFTFYTAFRPQQLYGKADTTRSKEKKNAKWNLGFAAYTPFGSGIKYEDDWLGQFILREMSLKIIFLQTTAGFQITDKLGFGIAHVYGFGNFYLRKGVPTADANGEYGEGILEGSASGHGMNAGLYYQVSDKLSLGASYRTSVKVKEVAVDVRAPFRVVSSSKVVIGTPPTAPFTCLNLTASPVEKL